MNSELYPGEFEAMEKQKRLDAVILEQEKITREEAIAELKDMPIHYPLTNTYDKASRLMQARDMAVEALEHPERNVVAIVPCIKLTNPEWIDFLCEQFDISRTSAKEMLHAMMSVKREDNFKKQFSGRRE